MAAVERDAEGRYVVRDESRVYGAYRTARMAEYRLAQLANCRRPKKDKLPRAARAPHVGAMR